MKIENDIGNIIYDSQNPKCSIEISHSQGEDFAFVTALDIGMEHARLKEARPVQYWGKYNHNDQESSILNILHCGGKWPSLNNRH